jgi:hypothetical protein
MADKKTEEARAIATADLDEMTKKWYLEGLAAGAAAERERVRAVEEQSMPGHEDLVQKLMFDGHTTGDEAAVLAEAAGRSTHQVDSSTSENQVVAIAKREFADDSNLQREFGSEAAYISWRKAAAAGRIRVLNERRVN